VGAALLVDSTVSVLLTHQGSLTLAWLAGTNVISHGTGLLLLCRYATARSLTAKAHGLSRVL
jgi:hypothetical protein